MAGGLAPNVTCCSALSTPYRRDATPACGLGPVGTQQPVDEMVLPAWLTFDIKHASDDHPAKSHADTDVTPQVLRQALLDANASAGEGGSVRAALVDEPDSREGEEGGREVWSQCISQWRRRSCCDGLYSETSRAALHKKPASSCSSILLEACF